VTVTRTGKPHSPGPRTSDAPIPGPTFVEGDRGTLRTVEKEDLEFLQHGTNHPEIRRYVNVFDTPRNRVQQREAFENVDFDDDATSLLIVPREGSHADEPVGSAQLYPVDLKRRWANLGAWLLPETWGCEYATEACAYLLDHAFLERGLHRVSASVLAPNEDSVALCERLGFAHEGRAGIAGSSTASVSTRSATPCSSRSGTAPSRSSTGNAGPSSGAPGSRVTDERPSF
jgi:RimJ/RimL family protein N-acetyltransferase